MKKRLIVQYEVHNDKSKFNTLIVADPNKTLPNGNNEIIKILFGSYADDIFKELTEGE